MLHDFFYHSFLLLSSQLTISQKSGNYELLYMLQGGLNFCAKCYVENVVLQITSTLCLTLKKIVSLESLVYLYPQDDYRLALILAQ